MGFHLKDCPSKCFEFEFNPSESEIYKNMFPNQFEECFESRLMKIG